MATEAEQQEFESMCNLYPEVAEARDAFESSLEQKMMEDAKQPPAFLKQNIEERLTATVPDNIVEEDLYEGPPVRRMGVWKWLAAASIVLLAGAAYWVYITNKKYQELQAENNSLKEQIANSGGQMQQLMQDAETLKHPMRVASLKGTGVAPQAFATVYWDTAQTKSVYLLISNLPEPPSDKQYQLWALLDGKPIDLGMFDMNIRQKRLLVKMQNVQKAQAFAITLEPKQKEEPSKPLGEMYVVGNL